MKSRTPGAGQAYLGAYTDDSGEWLDGGREYTLHIPADPPAKRFWSVTAYDAGTRALVDNDQQRGATVGHGIASCSPTPDGSVDLHFGPASPSGREANWVQTVPGRHWFAYLRLYGPLQPYFDRSWKPGDITAS